MHILDNLSTITQDGDMETNGPIFSPNFSALIVCNIHF